MSQDLLNAISLQALVDGALLLDLQDGQTRSLFGPVAAPASLSASPVRVVESTTSGISGPNSSASSRSVALQSSLGSRLEARLDVNGSPEYALTWKHWDMESGPPICALRASQRRISDKDFGGWPTPNTMDGIAPRSYEGAVRQASIARKGRTSPAKLREVVDEVVCRAYQDVAGWATPACRDFKSESATEAFNQERDAHPRGKPLSYQATLGATTGYHVETEKRGVLNPDLPRWLMAYPTEWDLYGGMVTLSRRPSQRNLSERT